ncbi:MAG: hypothetical protein M3258_00375 [Thermoproteota archaeon]|jgi:hypothetical protein|nr:hypothetical protein [Thermoproteota archaeon]
MSILTELGKHKPAIIAAGGAVLLLAAYFIPWDSILESAAAAKGGNGGGDGGNHNGNDNPNRYKVCEKKELQGKDKLPQKCYGIMG